MMANNENVQSSMYQQVTIPFKAIGDSIREPYGSSLVDLNSATGFLKNICEENLSHSNVTQLIHPPPHLFIKTDGNMLVCHL